MPTSAGKGAILILLDMNIVISTIKLCWFRTSELMEKTAYYTNVWQALGVHAVSRLNIYKLVLSPSFLIIYPCQKQPPNVCYATQSVHL